MSVTSELKKGALVNFFGVVGKIAAPAFLIVVNRLYGADVFGIYITANITIEIILAFLTSGFKDGALIFVSRHADNEDESKELYNSLANAFAWSMGFASMILIAGLTFGDTILELIYESEFSNGLSIMFGYMILVLPLMALERIVLAATQGLKIMKYDAISNGWLRPTALLLFSALLWAFAPNITGIALAYVLTQCLLFTISIWVYHKELSWAELYHSFSEIKVDKELLDFAIPQNINMTLNRFITGIDILMLPAFGFNATTVGFYGAGSMIVREVKAIKMVFSTAFAPFIVRMHRVRSYEQLSHHFSKTSGWVASLTIPVLLLIAIFRDDLLMIIQPDFYGESTFMLFLLPIPYLYCSFSLAGNIVAMTGHSKLTLLNSILTSLLNVFLNILLIPEFGVIGAALASSFATLSLSSLELFEARKVANAKLYLRDIYKPHLAGLFASILLVSAISFVPWFSNGVLTKTLLALILIGIFSFMLGLDYLRALKNRI